MNEEWLLPWYRIEGEALRSALEQELERELTKSNPLWTSSPRTILARRNDQDDVLVIFDNGKIAEVHLTWGQKEGTPTVANHSHIQLA
jgi:hypothetical protein